MASSRQHREQGKIKELRRSQEVVQGESNAYQKIVKQGPLKKRKNFSQFGFSNKEQIYLDFPIIWEIDLYENIESEEEKAEPEELCEISELIQLRHD